ncbi:MAG: hypothetical protein GF364_21150 [Candidatus Lokiarchaeota archaeon]|nr:hypothetical protein [Candidatus Lokiarchaeota archaeon]
MGKETEQSASIEELDKSVGQLLWGNDANEFSMGRLVFAFLKRRIKLPKEKKSD